MNPTDQRSDLEREEQTVERVLKAVGRGKALPDDTRVKWDDSFKRELELVINRRRRARRVKLTGFGATAAVLLIAVFLNLMSEQGSGVNDWAVVQKSIGTVEIDDSLYGQKIESLKIRLADRAEIVTHADSLVAVSYRDTRLRINENTRIQLAADEILLFSGQLYVDSDGDVADSAIQVRTPLGTVRDIGTQFSVLYDRDGLTAAVRDGGISVRTEVGEYTAMAAQSYAQQLVVSPENEVSVTRTSRSGDSWRWTESLVSEFSIEGRSAYDFLVWASKETGLHLTFASEAVEARAKKTILHGDIRGFSLPEVIDVVLATTDLAATRIDDNILSVSRIRQE